MTGSSERDRIRRLHGAESRAALEAAPGTDEQASGPFSYINSYYSLDVKVGAEFLFCGSKGVVVECHGNYIGGRLYSGGGVASFHPTWGMEYLPATSTAEPTP